LATRSVLTPMVVSGVLRRAEDSPPYRPVSAFELATGNDDKQDQLMPADGQLTTPDPFTSAFEKSLARDISARDLELGRFILETARQYSQAIGGRPDGFRECVVDCIIHREKLKLFNEVHQHLQTIFTPKYEERLFEYYQSAQYLLLLSFLSYPFAGLASHVDPFVIASTKLGSLDVLDYGAGIPYGIIHLLRTCPEKVRSLTVVDLDLVHTAFSEYVLKSMAPKVPLTYFKLRDPEQIPELGDQKFNLLYGKDIFEHLKKPEPVFRTMLASAASECLGFFDLRHHGERYLQHVTPDVTWLVGVASQYSFRRAGEVGGLSMFWRGASPAA
jgi:hypothetical protein